MQKIKEAVLSSKGQITVPKAIREILHVENGDSLVFYIEDDEVKITSTNNLDIKLKNEKRKAFVRKEK
ncbi:MAG: AbrB/MazE/SpoVT family DNA-binding domain-containing protein [Clostridia bacterium]|nr:AbrB/MazE/SpoVT family DNA-binding domain-containing protein [Clostridia bacterium]